MLETALGLFALGTIWFWLLMIGSSIAIIAFLENDKAWASTVTFVFTIAALIGLGNMGILSWIMTNPLLLLGVIALYFVCGTVWMCFKWWLFVTNRGERYKEKMGEFIEELDGKLIDFEKDPESLVLAEFKDEAYLKDAQQTVKTGKLVGKLWDAWREYVKNHDNDCTRAKGYKTIPDYKNRLAQPLRRNHKGRIIAWATYWPWSFFWTVLNDPIRRIMRRIYWRLSAFLDKISDRAYKKINEELNPPEPEETE
jgi:hypothetical protein